MHASPATPVDILYAALEIVRNGEDPLFAALDALPAAIYVTDADGLITHYNRACLHFSGRVPTPGRDRWCVTWKLYGDDGAPLPHDQCPMAVALREKRPVRGVTAVAERPDGTRVSFMPYPTPLLDADGNLTGAVNMLIDIADRSQSDFLDAQAARCRRLANAIGDRQTASTLGLMAAEYDEQARKARRPH